MKYHEKVKYLKLATIFIIFTLPSYLLRFKFFGVPLTILEVMILVTFSAWFLFNHKEIISNIKTRASKTSPLEIPKIQRYPFDIELALLLIISFISVAVAGFTNEAFGIWKAYFFEPLLFYILLFSIFNVGEREEKTFLTSGFAKIVWPLALMSFLVSVFAVYQKITGNFIANPFWAAEATRRVVSVFDYPNALGLYLAPIVLLMFGYMAALVFRQINTPSPRPSPGEARDYLGILFFVVTIILSLLSIYFAHSEGAIVGIAAGLIAFGLLIGKKIRLLTLVFLAIAFIMVFANINLRAKVVEKMTLSDFSGEVRKQQWHETWRMLTESPQQFIFGAGLSGYQKAVKPYHQEGIFFNKNNDPDFYRKIRIFDAKYKAQFWQPVEIYMYPHNIFLNFWSEIGLAGALLMVWVIGKFFYLGLHQVFQNSPPKADPPWAEKLIIITLICVMIAIVVHGIVDVPYFKNDLAVMFWIIVAMMGMFLLKNRT